MHILLVEDDPQLVQSLTTGLTENGYAVDSTDRVDTALHQINTTTIDLLLLDLGLPETDGTDLLRALRDEGSTLPVVILTARDSLEDRVDGLREGADDYLSKPFAFSELLARIEAVLRRTRRDDAQLAVGDLQLNRLNRSVAIQNVRVDLTQRETDILAYMMLHRERAVSRDELTRNVWKVRSRATPMDNVIDVTMSRLRKKLVEAFDHPFLETIRGIGYQIRP